MRHAPTSTYNTRSLGITAQQAARWWSGRATRARQARPLHQLASVIEVWLPTASNWNGRIRAWGNGGWAGSSQTDLTRIGGGDGNDLFVTAAGKGYVVATSDHGHTSPFSGIDGSFALNPDATINTRMDDVFKWHENATKGVCSQFPVTITILPPA